MDVCAWGASTTVGTCNVAFSYPKHTHRTTAARAQGMLCCACTIAPAQAARARKERTRQEKAAAEEAIRQEVS
jgi:hypothetical protein